MYLDTRGYILFLKGRYDEALEDMDRALKVADDKRTLAEQAKAGFYRLVAAREVASVMETSDPPKPANGLPPSLAALLPTPAWPNWS